MGVFSRSSSFLSGRAFTKNLTSVRTHCFPRHAVAIEPKSPAAVSAKREYLRIQLETFGRLAPETAKRECRDGSRMRKTPLFAALSRIARGSCPSAGLAGWRRSADRTRLRAN